MTGTHRGVHSDIVFPVASGPWNGPVFAAMRKLGSIPLHRHDVDGDTEVVSSSMSAKETKEKAYELAQVEEKKACFHMVPGKLKRGLKLNTTVDGLELEKILVPIYAVEVEYKGRNLSGYVDGAMGMVFASPPTSTERVFSTIAVSVGVVVLGVALFLAVGGIMAGVASHQAAEQARIEAIQREETARAEEERLAALRVELDGRRDQLVELLDAVGEPLEAREPEAARLALTSAESEIKPYRDDLGEEALAEIWPRLVELRGGVEHIEAVATGLEKARAVVGDEEKCNTPLELSEAWSDLQAVTAEDPEWREATRLASRMERCRAATERDLTNGLRDLMVSQREELAKTMEVAYLDGGFDIGVRVQGQYKDQIRFTYVLFSKALVHQLTDGGSMSSGALLRNLQDAGFKKVVFSDGYNSYWTYTLEPTDESSSGKEVLKEFGLGEPIRLSQ